MSWDGLTIEAFGITWTPGSGGAKLMFIVSVILVYLGIMAVSDKLWGNPLAFIGVGYLAFCVTMLGGVVLKAISLSI